MKIKKIPVGYLQANCYIVTKNNKTIIIDPGDEADQILRECTNLNVVGILVTHHHFDHIGALEQIEQSFHLKHNPQNIDGFNYEIIKTPGHSKDSISFYFKEEKILFSGDFIFFHNIGRCDLEGGDFKEMQNSIKKILNYPKDITIYPGHDINTNLEKEILYLQQYI